MNKTVFLGLAILITGLLVGGAIGTAVHPVHAQLSKDPGASGFADPAAGWKPQETGPHCIGCIAEETPGLKALKAGIVGPD
jgi:hypothetical protein